jgi:Spy/CpxP family protein refolding chaperone
MLMGPEGRLLHGGGRLAETLKLTAAQRQKLSDIGDDFARQAIRARADLTVARLDLAKDLRRETPDRSEIDGRIDAVAKLRASLMKSAVEARLDARDVLTAEQRRQLADMPFRGGAK